MAVKVSSWKWKWVNGILLQLRIIKSEGDTVCTYKSNCVVQVWAISVTIEVASLSGREKNCFFFYNFFSLFSQTQTLKLFCAYCFRSIFLYLIYLLLCVNLIHCHYFFPLLDLHSSGFIIRFLDRWVELSKQSHVS